MMNWDCSDCGTNTRSEYYMVWDHIWEVYGADPFLCIGCLEDRMGRELWGGDFTHYPVNNVNQWDKSDRLVDRLERATPMEGTRLVRNSTANAGR